MRKIKIMIANLIWRFCKISPKTGNFVMDLVGWNNYIKISKLKTLK